MDAKHIAIGFILILALSFAGSQLLAVSGTGYTVNSITTNIPIITENTNLKDVKYIISTTFNGGGQSVTARITPDDVASKSNYESEQDFIITATAIDEKLLYPILNTGQSVYKYSTETVDRGGCSSDAAYVLETSTALIFNRKDVCIYKKVDATVGNIDNPTVRNQAKITVSSSDSSETYTKTIDTATQQSVYFNDKYGDRIVDASWTGNLVTGNPYPSPANYVAVFPDENSGWTSIVWRISPRGELETYKSVESTVNANFRRWETEEAYFSTYDELINAIDEQIDDVNSARYNLVSGSSSIGSAQTYVDRDDINDGQVQITLDRNINNMMVLFKVSADWIGVNIPSGKPDILSVNCPEFASGDSSGYCEISVKNTGDGSATFVGAMLDCGAFTQKFNSAPISFSSGETDLMKVYIDHGLVASDLTRTCTFKVYDYNDASLYDTISGTVTMTEAKSCVPGTLRKDNRILYQCNSAGTGEDILQACETGETLLRGDDQGDGLEGYYCEEGSSSDSSAADWLKGLIDDLFNGNAEDTLKTLFLYVIILASVVGGIYLIILMAPKILLKLLLGMVKR